MSTRTPGWAKEILELAGVFFAAAVAHVFASGVASQHDGSVILLVCGATLIVASALVRIWHARRISRRASGGQAAAIRRSRTTPMAASISAEPEPTAHIVRGDRDTALWRLRVQLEDRPGRLAFLAGVLAGLSVDIRSLEVHPAAVGVVDELLVDAPASVTAAELSEALLRAGGTEPHVTAADLHELIDPPAAALRLAARVAADPAELPGALADLLDADDASRTPLTSNEPDQLSATVLSLADPQTGMIRLTRPALPFTPAEFARAQALRDLAIGMRSAHRGRAEATTNQLPEISIDEADQLDFAAVRDLHRRCSPESRYRRYGTPAGPNRAGLRSLLAPGRCHTLLVRDSGGDVVAMGCLIWRDDDADLGLLVRDDRQGLGLGTILTQRLIQTAEDRGIAAVHAVIQPDDVRMIELMHRVVDQPVHRSCDGGALRLTAGLRGEHAD